MKWWVLKKGLKVAITGPGWLKGILFITFVLVVLLGLVLAPVLGVLLVVLLVVRALLALILSPCEP